jgi:hypothetical protein
MPPQKQPPIMSAPEALKQHELLSTKLNLALRGVRVSPGPPSGWGHLTPHPGKD